MWLHFEYFFHIHSSILDTCAVFHNKRSLCSFCIWKIWLIFIFFFLLFSLLSYPMCFLYHISIFYTSDKLNILISFNFFDHLLFFFFLSGESLLVGIYFSCLSKYWKSTFPSYSSTVDCHRTLLKSYCLPFVSELINILRITLSIYY